MIKIIAFILCTTIAFNIEANTISINDKDVSESFSEKVKVSGQFHLGMQYNSNSKIDKLYLLFPENAQGELCVGIASIDGRYKASIKHKLKSPTSGVVLLDFPSKYQEELKGYMQNELAVLAKLGNSCNQSKIIAALWSLPLNEGRLQLLIRSDARKDVVLNSSNKKKFKCKKFKNKYKVTYDKYCDLKDLNLSEVSELLVKRKNLQKIADEKIELAY